MGDEWQRVTIDSIARKIAIGPFGSRMKSDTYTETGVPVIRGANLTNGRAFTGEWVFVANETADELINCNVFKDDLVFPHRGAIGEVGVVPGDRERYLLSTSLMMLRCDPERAYPLYLYYFFKSREGQHELLKNASQVGTPGIGQPLSSLKSIELSLPSIDEQRAIAHILGTLDDKIELNRRMNETLEAMARALFKSCFVDFEPVRAKVEGRDTGLPKEIADLFPDSFEDSELGEVPKGWMAGKIGNLASLSRSSLTPGEFADELFDHYSIPAFDEGRTPKEEAGETIKSNKFIVSSDCVLLSKLNPRIPRIWLPVVGGSQRSICSTEFLVLLPIPNVSREFLYCLFSCENFIAEFATLVTGTSGSHQRVKPESLLQLDVVVPPQSLIRQFTTQVSPFLQRLNQNIAESRTLAAQRDALLPKLLAGEVRVTDAEWTIEV